MAALVSATTRHLWKTIFKNLSFSDAKSKEELTKKLLLLTAVSGHDNKHTYYRTQIKPKWIFGDDACFCAKHKDGDVIGLADGVGGWRTYGIDPSTFSQSIMNSCQRLVTQGKFDPSKPMFLIDQGYEDVLNLKQPVLGSATTCVITLSRVDGRIYAASLGDSGFLVVRRGRVVVRSETQKHSFNTPFQLAILPADSNGQFHKDRPDQAMEMSADVEPGDLIVAGTDGLFDNLAEPVILQEVKHVEESSATDFLQACADRLVEKARQSAADQEAMSPFASEARRHGINFIGGNPGDITVVLGLVVIDSHLTSVSQRIDHDSSKLSLSAYSPSSSAHNSPRTSLNHQRNPHRTNSFTRIASCLNE